MVREGGGYMITECKHLVESHVVDKTFRYHCMQQKPGTISHTE